jgi:hypothetical protein
MFLAPFYSLMMEHNVIFRTSVGVNMHADIDRFMHDWLSTENVMEFDYSNYDQSMPFQISHAANTIIYRVLKHFGYNEKALDVVCGILSDCLFPTLNMLNDIFVVPGLQPSGKYATAEDNSLKGTLLLMYAYESLRKGRGKGYFQDTTITTYGDDAVGSVVNDAIVECIIARYMQISVNLYMVLVARVQPKVL